MRGWGWMAGVSLRCDAMVEWGSVTASIHTTTHTPRDSVMSCTQATTCTVPRNPTDYERRTHEVVLLGPPVPDTTTYHAHHTHDDMRRKIHTRNVPG